MAADQVGQVGRPERQQSWRGDRGRHTPA